MTSTFIYAFALALALAGFSGSTSPNRVSGGSSVHTNSVTPMCTNPANNCGLD